MQFCDICFCTLCAISNAKEHRKRMIIKLKVKNKNNKLN